MCLIVFAHQYFSAYKLALLSNRDEYHERATTPAGFWPSHPAIFGGRDEVASGSWLSVDTSGRLAAVTNVRKPPFNTTAEISRGLLVKDFLSQPLGAEEYLSNLKKRDYKYGLFNVLLFDKSGGWHYSNDTRQIQQIDNGIHSLSNASLDTPWPKTRQAVDVLESTKGLIVPEQLLTNFRSDLQSPDNELPDTGVELELERLLSSVFIKSERYGTRCSTLITIDYKNTLEFHELSYGSEGQVTSSRSQKIDLL